MNKEQKRNQCLNQIDLAIEDIKKDLIKKLDRALNSGCVPQEYYNDDFLLTKALLNSFILDNNYKALDKKTEKEFKNIHLFV